MGGKKYNNSIATSIQTKSRDGGKITDKGKNMNTYLDQVDVENHWLAGEHVNWKIGVKDSDKSTSTHCSEFVAAVAFKLDIPFLYPPGHLLANAQQNWLEQEGLKNGWKQVTNMKEAQILANNGNLVVASYKNPNAKKHGHTAIIRPSEKSIQMLNKEGPEIIQAGTHNYSSTNLKEGFKYHKNAFKDKKILFFSHEIQNLT